MAHRIKGTVHHQEQLLLDWDLPRRQSEIVEPTPDMFATGAMAPPSDTEPTEGQSPTPKASPESTHEHGEARPSGEVPSLVQVLPWDFHCSFPQPLEDAIITGKLNEEDGEPENLKALHDEHARHALSILSDLDAVLDARRRGVDPSTGNAPKTEKHRERLHALFRDEPDRLERTFNTLLDVYEESFGNDATDAFRKAIRAWHAGIEVIAEGVPLSPPLAPSVQGGVFGMDDDGNPVRPSNEEVEAIVDEVGDRLLASPDHETRTRLLAKYTEDFGKAAADELVRWTNAKTRSEKGGAFSYDPGHPWHYYAQGDGADPIPLDEIPAANADPFAASIKLPKDATKRAAKMGQMLADQEGGLKTDESRYLKLIEKGVDGLSDYDRRIANGGDDELAWASTMALMYNRIRNARGRVKWLHEVLARSSKEA